MQVLINRLHHQPILTCLHDPQLRSHFFLTKQSVKQYLVNQGFVTDDNKVLGTITDIKQGAKVGLVALAVRVLLCHSLHAGLQDAA